MTIDGFFSVVSVLAIIVFALWAVLRMGRDEQGEHYSTVYTSATPGAHRRQRERLDLHTLHVATQAHKDIDAAAKARVE